VVARLDGVQVLHISSASEVTTLRRYTNLFIIIIIIIIIVCKCVTTNIELSRIVTLDLPVREPGNPYVRFRIAVPVPVL